MSGFETILYEKRGPIAWITLNRPRVLNVYNIAMRDDLYQVLEAVRDDPEVEGVILSGAGERAFCAGADLTEFGTAPSQAIARKVAQVLEAKALPFVLGGDHSITLPSATAVADAWGRGKVGIIHFDSHADTAPDSFGGSLIAHGSPMRRLIESGAVAPRNFVQIGLRGYWPPQEVWEWMEAQGMRWHLMAEIEERGFDVVIDEAIDQALDGPEYIYLSVDIDVLDPGFAPGTGTPEPGGITPAQLLRAVRNIVSRVELVAMDMVEVSPPYDDPGAVTAEVAHRVVLEAITGLAAKRASQGSRA